ncbi:hypothetical protein RhiirB3_525383 [Rhizophagus irregularis]|nr:hypothetical protein RhiirB3_525383 [Rhizophagus irregularis]
MNKSDKFIAEQFDINDINDEEWTMNKCKQFLRFIQENPTNTRIEKEKDDENHIFLPKYIKTVNENGKKFYEWKSSELDDIFEAIFQFLDKEAKLQNDFIKDVNDKWLPGFKYLYEFEYQRADYKGDLIVANDLGILAVVETKIIGYFPWQKNKNVNKVEKQAINYRNILMEETKDNPEIITVIGSYFLDQCHSGNEERRGFPLDIDSKIWNAIKQVNESNKKSPGKFVVPTISGETLNDLKATEEQIVEDLDGLNLEDEKN